MPDWQQLVRERLSRLDLDVREREEVCTELAAHLEEDYQYSLAAGASEHAAFCAALRHVHDWQELKRKIEFSRMKEPSMNKRVSQFWFPAFIMLSASMSLLALIEIFGPKPWVTTPAMRGWRFVAPAAVIYVPWLLALPFIGAGGAWLSRRTGASARTAFSSIVFPVLPYLAFFVIGLPIAVILDDRITHNIMIPAFFVGLVAWVILPATALLAGGLPVHFWTRSGPRNPA